MMIDLIIHIYPSMFLLTVLDVFLYAGKMVLPFEPLSMVFQDVQYYIETPLVNMKRNCIFYFIF